MCVLQYPSHPSPFAIPPLAPSCSSSSFSRALSCLVVQYIVLLTLLLPLALILLLVVVLVQPLLAPTVDCCRRMHGGHVTSAAGREDERAAHGRAARAAVGGRQ